MKKIKSIATIVLFGLLTLTLGSATFLMKDSAYSAFERRPLAQMPQYSESGSLAYYIADWEDYLVDQFAFRDELRFFKSIFARNVLQSSDVNGYIIKDGSEAELLYPMKDDQIVSNITLLEKVRSKHFAESDAYFAVIPDKSVYLDVPLGLDYGFIRESISAQFGGAQIDLSDCLTADDFYRTDIHWKQENLKAVYEKLRAEMNSDLPAFDSLGAEVQSTGDFYGVLYGQAAYPIAPDELVYLTGDWLEGCRLTVIDNGQQMPIYQPDKATGDDPYDLFMGGEYAITVIENSNVTNGRELVLFRDSFSRSLAPLLAAGYEKITLVDLRLVKSFALGNYLPDLASADRKIDMLVLLSGQVLEGVRYI